MNPDKLIQKIVIVEDNPSLAEIYKVRMEALGYQTSVANDGITALQLIQTQLPDLVLLDLMVPKLAGDQILATMRASEWGKKIKVMIISNLNEADAPAGLRDYGIEGYAVKANLSNDQLDQLVDAILKPADQEEDIMLGTDENTNVNNQADATTPSADPTTNNGVTPDTGTTQTAPDPAVAPTTSEAEPAAPTPEPVVTPEPPVAGGDDGSATSNPMEAPDPQVITPTGGAPDPSAQAAPTTEAPTAVSETPAPDAPPTYAAPTAETPATPDASNGTADSTDPTSGPASTAL